MVRRHLIAAPLLSARSTARRPQTTTRVSDGPNFCVRFSCEESRTRVRSAPNFCACMRWIGMGMRMSEGWGVLFYGYGRAPCAWFMCMLEFLLHIFLFMSMPKELCPFPSALCSVLQFSSRPPRMRRIFKACFDFFPPKHPLLPLLSLSYYCPFAWGSRQQSHC